MTKRSLLIVSFTLPAMGLIGSNTYASESVNTSSYFKFHRQLAHEGNIDSMILLGNMYERGKVVERDYEKALLWYKKASLKGSARALEKHRQLSAVVKKSSEQDKQPLLIKIKQIDQQMLKQKSETFLKLKQSLEQEMEVANQRLQQQTNTTEHKPENQPPKQLVKSSTESAANSSGPSSAKSAPIQPNRLNMGATTASIPQPVNAAPSGNTPKLQRDLGLSRTSGVPLKTHNPPPHVYLSKPVLYHPTNPTHSTTEPVNNEKISGNTKTQQHRNNIQAQSKTPKGATQAPKLKSISNQRESAPGSNAGFNANPCEGVKAQFMSTCR